MKVLVVNTNRCANPVAVMPIGACAVAEATAAAGHEVRFLDLMFSKRPLEELSEAVAGFGPDVVGLSVRNIDNTEMMAARFFLDELPAQVARARGAGVRAVVLGGAALGVMPEEILRLAGASLAVTGAGHVVFPALLERIGAGRPVRDLPGVAWLEDGTFGQVPLPAAAGAVACLAPTYGRWLKLRAYREQMVTAPIRTKDGCRFRCVYCPHAVENRGVRTVDPERVADAAARYVAEGVKDLEFVDDLFNSPREHALAVCEAIGRRRLGARLQCLELSPVGLDDELLDAMGQAGFAGMGVTLESAADPVLARLRKGFTRREVNVAVEVVRRHEIPCAWIFMLGGPGETRETVLETLRFAEERIRPSDMVFCNIGVRILPGTELERIARAEGRLSVPRAEMLRPAFYVSPHVEVDWIKAELKACTKRRMNFIDADTMNYDFMPALNRVSHWLGFRPPLWRYARFINAGLRWTGLG